MNSFKFKTYQLTLKVDCNSVKLKKQHIDMRVFCAVQPNTFNC